MDNLIAAADKIKGWMSLEELEWLYQVAQRMAGGIVELGCHRGRSTFVLLSGCPGQVYAVDCHWCGTMHPFEKEAQHTRPEFDQAVGHFSNLVALEMNFEEAATSPLIPDMVDCVFIDGDHAYESALLDLKTWEPRARKMICGHDLNPETPGVQQALDEYFGPGKVSQGPGKLWYIDK
jgi:predicted O-methyltransferase YrrM